MTTNVSSLDASIQKTIAILRDIEDEFGWTERRQQSYAIVRGVLHALRDRFTVEQAAHFAAQLPLILQGVFYEGWRPANLPLRMHRTDFLDHIRSEFPFSLEIDFEGLVSYALQVILEHMSPGEAEKIRKKIPADIAELF